MNCKPGDLAVFVRARHVANVGRVVRVVAPLGRVKPGDVVFVDDVAIAIYDGGFVWQVEADRPLPGSGFQKGAAFDHHLRPIRDPGDDARDETLDWLPVPTKEPAHG